MPDSPEQVVDHLRQRIQRAVQAGVLLPGAKLPSARRLQTETGIDQRVLLAAYRELERERLVEMRNRGGIYLAPTASSGSGVPGMPEEWITEMFTHGVARDIPLPELHEWMRRSVETLRLRAVAFESTEDQRAGLCRELIDDYGLEASAHPPAVFDNPEEVPVDVRRADLFVTTPRYETVVRSAAERMGKHCVVAAVRPDLISGEWRLLLVAPVYLVVADRQFIATLTRFFADTPGAENLRMLVVGEDDLLSIPTDAPTYVTRRAREQLGDQRIPGRILPAPRLFSTKSATEIIGFIVRANLRALRAGSD